MTKLRRGIAPEILLSQVKNTMPYLFEAEVENTPLGNLDPTRVLREFEKHNVDGSLLSHFEYFRLCLSSHYLTCGTPVPTDVDNQIRQKLWPAELPLEIALEMAQLVIESRNWDFRLLSSRVAQGAAGSSWGDQPLTGHLGEWFTVSCAAYCALGRYTDSMAHEKRQELFQCISDEVHRHSEIFGTLMRANDGLGALKASALVAHNFGDLDRVMDMWELSVADPLRLEFYKLTASPFGANGKLRYLGRLWVAGELYKSPIDGSSMAMENHRHFALRKPKVLRTNQALTIPLGPFFDDWGQLVARALSPAEELPEVVEALKHGWDRLPGTIGYGRALRGVIKVYPDLELGISAKGRTDRVNHAKLAVLAMPQDRFETNWAEKAVYLMDEIPSRA